MSIRIAAAPFVRTLPPLASLARVVVIVLALAGCGDNGSPNIPAGIDGDNGRANRAAAVEIVATVDDTEIALDDIEAPLRLQLQDLAMQRFRLLRSSLLSAAAAAIEASPDGSRVAVLSLEPPLPPRVSLDIDPARVRPAEESPVTIAAFCNFESPHCARLQMTLSAVSSLYSGIVRFAALDLPLAFHRNAARAAEGARCALEQGNYWRFHDALYAGSGVLDDDRLMRTARASQLDQAAFRSCLDGGRRAADVAADAAMAAELHIAGVPAVFVNGLYASPEVDGADLIWLIEHELEQLGVSSPRPYASDDRSTAPLLVRALFPSTHAGQGAALLAPAVAPERVELVREGALISESVIVARVTRDGIALLEPGGPRWLEARATSGRSDAPSPEVSEGVTDLPIVTPHRAVPVTLDRNEVLVRLGEQAALQDALVTVPMRSGDYRQLRVTEVAPGSLYELLGVEPGDVLLGVNEQPIHEGDNPLWRVLENENEVRLRVMRRGGIAHHYTYRFTE